MERFTEYHNGVAVIRDKSLLKDAMRKLASYEDLEEHIQKSFKAMKIEVEKIPPYSKPIAAGYFTKQHYCDDLGFKEPKVVVAEFQDKGE